MIPAWLAALSFVLVSSLPPDEGSGATLCNGCIGAGLSAVASGGGCPGASVSVSVTVVSGSCAWVYDDPTSSADCRQRRACEVTVERTWTNLPAYTPLDICITLVPGEQTLCLGKNAPNAGATGSGRDVRTGPDMDCTAGSRLYSIGASACGLSATAQATCSPCTASESEH